MSSVPRLGHRAGGPFDGLYRRLGSRYYTALVSATVVVVVVVSAPLQNLAVGPLWIGSFHEWKYLLLIDALAALAGLILAPAVLLRRHRAIRSYLAGEPVPAEQLWHSSVTRLPATSIIATAWWMVLTIVPGFTIIGHLEHFSPRTYVLSVIANAMISVGVGAYFLLLYEVALLPIAVRAARDLPPDFAPRRRLTMSRRLTLLTAAITLTTGVQIAGLSAGFHGRDSRLWGVVLLTVVMVFTYVGLMTYLVTFSVTHRVTVMRDALNQVGNTDDPVRILPTTGDELDELGRAFNHMVDMLDGHDLDMRESRARLVTMADATRRQMERDLHDGAQQHLALVAMKLARLDRRAHDDPALAAAVDRMRTTLVSAITDLRTIARGIYPASLEHEGIALTLESVGRQVGIELAVTGDDVDEIGPDIEAAVYFCCWEVLKATKARGTDAPMTVELTRAADVLRVAITDHGGEPPDEAVLRFIQDRWGAIGGEISPDPGAPHTLVGTVAQAGLIETART